MLTIDIIKPNILKDNILNPKEPVYILLDSDIIQINNIITNAFKKVWNTSPEAKKAIIFYGTIDDYNQYTSIVDILNWPIEKKNQLRIIVDELLRKAGYEFRYHSGKGGYIHILE